MFLTVLIFPVSSKIHSFTSNSPAFDTTTFSLVLTPLAYTATLQKKNLVLYYDKLILKLALLLLSSSFLRVLSSATSF